MLKTLNSPMMRLAALTIVLCNLGFALYILRDPTLPRKQRTPFVLGALVTGPFLFGRLYFKKVEQIRQTKMKSLRTHYAQRRTSTESDS